MAQNVILTQVRAVPRLAAPLAFWLGKGNLFSVEFTHSKAFAVCLLSSVSFLVTRAARGGTASECRAVCAREGLTKWTQDSSASSRGQISYRVHSVRTSTWEEGLSLKLTLCIKFSTLFCKPHHLNLTVTSLYAHIYGQSF